MKVKLSPLSRFRATVVCSACDGRGGLAAPERWHCSACGAETPSLPGSRPVALACGHAPLHLKRGTRCPDCQGTGEEQRDVTLSELAVWIDNHLGARQEAPPEKVAGAPGYPDVFSRPVPVPPPAKRFAKKGKR